jgi:hypothetical protein
VTRQRDRQFFARSRRRQQPAAIEVGHRDIDHIHRAAMFEAVDLLRERGFQAAAQDTVDAQHRVRPFQRLDLRRMTDAQHAQISFTGKYRTGG